MDSALPKKIWITGFHAKLPAWNPVFLGRGSIKPIKNILKVLSISDDNIMRGAWREGLGVLKNLPQDI
jgi:hypothetical protein